MSNKANSQEWVIATVKDPVLWSRSENETWMFNPLRRYILNSSQLVSLEGHLDTVSDLKNSRYYAPLHASKNLANSTILVERHRDRGHGDYLFLTGPLNYIKHISGGSAKVHLYALHGRASLLDNHPCISTETPLSGPIEYDCLPLYNYHWFIDKVTEYSEEKDQHNVYDALYAQLGIDPSTIPHQFKRPTVNLVDQDYKDLDSLYYFLYTANKQDLRRTGYYVVAPTCNSSLRSASYSLWLSVITQLSRIRPVVVVGQEANSRMPSTDMPYGTFIQHVDRIAANSNVFNLIGHTSVRVVAALISRAVAAVTLDSGPLYMAQAVRTPAVSLWGPVSPWSRIGYDQDYLDLAISNTRACPHSPCFAYSNFPLEKCPRGQATTCCELLYSISTEQVLEKISMVETRIAESMKVKQ